MHCLKLIKRFSPDFKILSRSMSGKGKDVTSFDYLVLGAGSGGIASARRATEFGVKTGIIEHGRLGGTCVSLLHSLQLQDVNFVDSGAEWVIAVLYSLYSID